MERKKLRYGQIGGTMNAFIGAVHRKAIAIDEQAELVAGCFSSSNEEANQACGEHYGIAAERIYKDFSTIAETGLVDEVLPLKDVAKSINKYVGVN